MNDGNLVTKLVMLNTIRDRLVELAKEEKRLSTDIIDELRLRCIDAFDFLDSHRASLERPVKTTIDVDRFRTACVRAGIAPRDFDEAIKRTVSLAAARKVLGGDDLAAISTTKPGNYRVRIISVRNTD